MMKIMAIEEKDIPKARYFAEKESELAHALEKGKYHECAPLLDVVCAEKNVSETYSVVNHLLKGVDSICDFRKSKLYEHMTFSEPNETILKFFALMVFLSGNSLIYVALYIVIAIIMIARTLAAGFKNNIYDTLGDTA